MKILIETMHMSKSIGASLQACALAKVLRDLGHEPTLLYYLQPFYTDITDRLNGVNTPRQFLSYCINGFLQEKDRKCFLRFKEQYHPPLTRKYCDPGELKADPPEFDAYVCGSDQVWNPNITRFDRTYFFPYVKNGGKKISYAASIGCDQISQGIREFLTEGISFMDSVSVREDTAAELIRRLLPDRKVTQNIDPTFLLSRDQWQKMETRPAGRVPEHYCLYYPLGNAELGLPLLQYIKGKYGLPSVSFNGSWFKEKNVDCNLHGVGPGEFLWLCRHADIVITNSFHGFSLSVNYGKQVICFEKPGQNSRMESLARLLHLEELTVSGLEQAESRDWEQIWSGCYSSIMPLIEKERLRSREYLEEALQI